MLLKLPTLRLFSETLQYRSALRLKGRSGGKGKYKMKKVAESFPPILPENPTILILGSMPGVKSLEAGEYYAHPQNLFWKIMGEALSFSPSVPYRERVCALENTGVALWDTLKFCERRGSLDSDIKTATEIPNDIGGLLAQNPSIRAVFFNGKKPEQVFKFHITPLMEKCIKNRIHIETLPSTSPANAGMAKGRKTALWKKAIREGLSDRGNLPRHSGESRNPLFNSG